MADVSPPPSPTQLVVFADDWGGHPSSSQHLVRALLPRYSALWVNTVGTRRPRLSWVDLGRAAGVVASWFVPRQGDSAAWPAGLEVLTPRMYPGFRRPWQRRLNARQVSRAVNKALDRSARRVAVTTLPITADLVGKLDVDRWVYYCVDDYSQWPGTDHAVMDAMERELVAKVDAVVCVSQTLRDRVASMGRRDATLLTHGVDPAMWQTPAADSRISPRWPVTSKAIALFWGLIDQRMDNTWCDRLAGEGDCCLVFAGPRQVIEAPNMARPPHDWLGPIAPRDLPAHAARASVLIMPYIDAPVTRAMQPLKLKEYLATMKPVVVRDLPATRDWADCCDLAGDAQAFARLVIERAKTGTPAEQVEARKRRLANESWSAKAAALADVVNG